MNLNLSDIFNQIDNKITINYKGMKVYFVMPDYFKINEVDDELKILSLILLFYPIDMDLKNYKFKRKSSGNEIGLAFSGGVDSMAAYAILPKDKTKLFHHKRVSETKSLYKHDNPMYVIDKLNSEVLIIESDLEDIRKFHKDYSIGFLNDFSFYAGFVLLVDYLNIGYLSTGMILESTYIKKGFKFRDFHNSNYYKEWFDFFKKANLPLFFPCIPCSEILTNKIVEHNGLFAQSCLRGTNGEGCDKCYKCFRKKLISGKKLEYNEKSEIFKKLNDRPLKQGASLISAMNKYEFHIEELKEYKNFNIHWIENYFDYTLISIPEEFREYIKIELDKYSKLDDNSLLFSFNLE